MHQTTHNSIKLKNHMHNIIDQNQELRQRILKLTQIEKYVEVLLDKTESLEKEKDYIQRQLGYITRQNQEVKHQLMVMKTSHQQEMRTVFIEHDNIYRGMQQQLTQIKILHEKQVFQNDQLRAFLSKQTQIQNGKFIMFQKEIGEYKQNLLYCQKQYQDICHQLQIQKQKHNIQTDRLLKDLHHIKNVVLKQNFSKVEELIGQNEKLRKDNTILVQYNQNISNRSALNEKQLSGTISKLSHAESILTKQNQHLSAILSQTQHRLRQITEQAAILLQQNLKLKQQLTQGCKNSQRLCYLLQESDKQNISLRQKLNELDRFIQSQTENFRKKLFAQTQQVYSLKQKLSQKELMITQKLSQIKELLQIVDQLQICTKAKQKELKLLNNDCEKLQGQIKKANLTIQQKIVELRSSQQTNKLMKKNIDQLQELNTKQKQAYLQLQTQNYNLARQLQNPRQISKQSEATIQKIKRDFHLERQEIAVIHQKEKNRIRETYQFQIKQKEIQYLRKIELFSQQLQRIKGIDSIQASIKTLRNR